MKQDFISIKEWILIFLSLFLLLPNFLNRNLTPNLKGKHSHEEFEPTLVKQLRSVDDVLIKSDSIAILQNINPKMLEYGVEVNKFIKKRFYHGCSYYSLKENAIAAILGYLIWDHLSAIVLPDDIMKHPMALCSQQSIVLMECFKRKGISYRKVGFDHHFAVEANFDNQWFYFDTDIEPNFDEIPRTDIQSIINSNNHYNIYRNKLDSNYLEFSLSKPFFSEPNISPAPNATIFQLTTKFLSRTAFIIPLIIIFYKRRKLYN